MAHYKQTQLLAHSAGPAPEEALGAPPPSLLKAFSSTVPAKQLCEATQTPQTEDSRPAKGKNHSRSASLFLCAAADAPFAAVIRRFFNLLSFPPPRPIPAVYSQKGATLA